MRSLKYLLIGLASIVFISASDTQGQQWSEPELVDNINGVIHDFYPSISPDGQTMYFTTGNRIRASHWNGTAWGESYDLGDNVNSGQRQVKATVTPDNRTLYFTSWKAGGYGSYDIWKSEWDDSCQCWGESVVMPPPINTEDMEWDVQLSYDGTKMYISSDRFFSWGAEDIWCSEWDSLTETWAEPVNLGTVINTSLPDYSPYPSIDGAELYFCSWDRHGLFPPEWQDPPEIFVAYNNNGVWDSLAIITEINSDYWEESPALSWDGESLYLASTRPGGPGWTDIYVSHLITGVRGSIYENNLKNKNQELRIYPNPSNSVFGFEFLKLETSSVLKIYNIKGQIVDEFRLDVNDHYLLWDSTDRTKNKVSSGVYFAVLEHNRNRVIKHFILLK